MHSTNIRLNLILERFSYPITEEQAWGICYLTACDLKSLPGPWIYTPNNVNRSQSSDNGDRDSDELPMEAVLLSRSGQLKIDRKILSSRFANFDSGTSCSSTTDSDSDCCSLLSPGLTSNATEYDLMGPLAVMLYKALDYRLEESEERELDPALSGLIEIMLEMEDKTASISSPFFGDGDLPEMSFDFHNRPALDKLNRVSTSTSPRHRYKSPDQLFSLDDLLQKCTSHYYDIKDSSLSGGYSREESADSHYLSVCKGMVDEYYSCNLNLDNLNFNEGMRSWDRIVQSLESHEYDLRQTERFHPGRKEPLDTVPEVSDLDALQSQIRSYKKQEMRHVVTNSHERGGQPLDPFSKTLDSIKNRKYNLKPLSERVSRETPELVVRASTPHEMLMEQIQQPPPLREVPQELKRRYTLDLHKLKYQKQFRAPKRYYPPKGRQQEPAKPANMDEYDIQDRERQAIVHGRSVSLPYERANKLKIQRVPLQLEPESVSYVTDPEPVEKLNWAGKSYSPPLCIRTDSFCSLDELSGRESYLARPPSSASADLLDLPSSRGYTSSSSRETMVLSCDESSIYYPDESENLSVCDDLFYREISPFAPSLLSMESSRSLEHKSRKHKRARHSHLGRASTSTLCDSREDRMRSPMYNSGVSQLQELSHQRYNWTQSQLAELACTHPSLYQDTMLGNICYVCNMKFNWKRWSTHCKLCCTKICTNCKTSKVMPASFFECSQIASNSSQQTKGRKERKLLICHHCNFFLCTKFNEPLSFFN